MTRRRKTAIVVFALAALLATPLLAASDYLRVDAVPGDSRQPGHEGWFDLASFSWGVSNLPPQSQVGSAGPGGGPACLRTHSLNFTHKGVQSARLTALCNQRATLPQLTVETNGERHLLQNVTFVQCTSQKLDAGNSLDTFSLNFTRCATHAGVGLAPSADHKIGSPLDVKLQKADAPNAILIGLSPKPEALSLLSLNFVGTTQARVVGRPNALMKACANGKHFPTVKITAKTGEQWTFSDVTIIAISPATISSVNGDGRGTESFSLNFTKVDGPLTGFRDLAYKE